ncbi:MAG: hypothetical protein KF730_17250 [Sphingomonas sp.]|uniref:hypothetical protein n=1 Tax=Sphingomonas sp. TaxID=28214 RepID=UPI0025F14C53|nr:hypothetical protein [Sphingomonas sp.]MBX3566309.1 hypothetical protein [Sphingomonas sp.]
MPQAVQPWIVHKVYYGHFLCHVLHQDYVLRAGVDSAAIKQILLDTLDARGAEYPAEHNVGHSYRAKAPLAAQYRRLDPLNRFNSGIGKLSHAPGWADSPDDNGDAMTRIYRCRTALSEAAGLFEAAFTPDASWAGEVYPARRGLIVTQAEDQRQLHPAVWGIPERRLGLRGKDDCPTIWFRELWEVSPFLFEPESRCIIVLDCFATPTGVAGRSSKSWSGLESDILFGWAGIWSGEGANPCFTGFVVAGNALVGHDRVMPALLRPSEAKTCLSGTASEAANLARRTLPPTEMWSEALGEPWNCKR